MFSKRFRSTTRSGSVLPFALVIMSAVSILLVSILGFVAAQLRNSTYTVAKEQAFQIAEAGVHFYKWYLAHETDGRTAQQIQAFWDSGTAYGVTTPYEADYYDPGGGLVGRYRIEVTNPPEQGSTAAMVKVTGWTYKYPASTRAIQIRFRRPSWSERAFLANDFMRFGTGTSVYGQIHSNQGIRFDGHAYNLVTSSVTDFNDPDHSGGNEFGVHTHVNPVDSLPPAAVPARTDVFEAGREFPLTAVDFNGVLGDLSYMKSEAQGTGGDYYNDRGLGRRIILKTNDTYDICTVQAANISGSGHNNGITRYYYNASSSTCANCSGSCLANYPIPDNGVIFVEDNVWLEGQINGKRITIAAADLSGGAAPTVYIGNDVRYTTYDGTDIIGVIGQNNVEIIRNSENDLRIDAALLAQQGRVGREYYDGIVKSVITVFGAIATNVRYGFAYTDGTGYQTRNIYYDTNLLYYPPPYFPTGTQYFVDLWEEL